jgi:HK97 family phage major capsid protein
LLVTGTTANFANVSNAHFRSMVAAVPGKYRMGAKWYCNATVFDAAMGPVLDAAGGNNYMDMANGASQTMFKGYPVVFVPSMIEAEDCVATSKPIIFGNVRAAAKLGDRRQVRIAQSEHRYFETDEIAVKGTSRFHAKVHAVGTAGQTGAYTVMQVS